MSDTSMYTERELDTALAYVQGRLDPKERERFEERLFANEELQREVQMLVMARDAMPALLPTPAHRPMPWAAPFAVGALAASLATAAVVINLLPVQTEAQGFVTGNTVIVSEATRSGGMDTLQVDVLDGDELVPVSIAVPGCGAIHHVEAYAPDGTDYASWQGVSYSGSVVAGLPANEVGIHEIRVSTEHCDMLSYTVAVNAPGAAPVVVASAADAPAPAAQQKFVLGQSLLGTWVIATDNAAGMAGDRLTISRDGFGQYSVSIDTLDPAVEALWQGAVQVVGINDGVVYGVIQTKDTEYTFGLAVENGRLHGMVSNAGATGSKESSDDSEIWGDPE